MTDPKVIGWRFASILIALVTLDQLVSFGALGVASRTQTPLLTRLSVSLVAVGVALAVLAVGRFTWLRLPFARRHAAVMAISVLVALQIGLTVSRQLLENAGFAVRQPGFAVDEYLFLAAIMLLLLLGLGVLLRHEQLVQQIEQTYARLDAAYTQSVAALAQQRATLKQQIQDLLEARLGSNTDRDALFTPERLRALAVDVLRPLAHKLADTSTRFDAPPAPVRPRLHVGVLLRLLRPEPVVKPKILAATMLFFTFRFSVTAPPEDLIDPATRTPDTLTVTVDWLSLIQSLVLHAATFGVVLVAAMALRRWLSRRASKGPLWRAWTVTLVALACVGAAAMTLIRLFMATSDTWVLPPVTPSVVVGFTVPLLLVTFWASVYGAAEQQFSSLRAEHVQVNDNLARAVARTNALLNHEQRLFARHLHASVQAAVNAASIRLEQAQKDGQVDAATLRDVSDSIDRAVAQLVGEPTADTSNEDGVTLAGNTDLDSRLNAITATWKGVATIHFSLTNDTRQRLADDPVARATATDLIAEACANAVIHGSAKTIDVKATSDDTDIMLQVSDDGTSVHPSRNDGLGSKMLSDSCTRWDLATESTGATLTAVLPVRPAAAI